MFFFFLSVLNLYVVVERVLCGAIIINAFQSVHRGINRCVGGVCINLRVIFVRRLAGECNAWSVLRKNNIFKHNMLAVNSGGKQAFQSKRIFAAQ